jgi:ribosome-binding protein aMBF1 (putative translation factor)
MTENESWDALRSARLLTPDAHAGYERARVAFEFGELVRALRESRKLTQVALAASVHTSQSAIARLEAGGSEPRLDMLQRLAAALGVELAVGAHGVRVVEPAA